MSSELQTPWSGPLKSKKKAELQQICRQLAIEYKTETLKADLEQQIRKRFKEDPSLQDDERFTKLEHSATSPSPNGINSRRSIRGRSVSRHRDPDGRSVSRIPEPDHDEQSSLEDESSRSNLFPTGKSITTEVLKNSEPDQILVTLMNPEQEPNHRIGSQSQSNPSSQLSRLAQQTNQQVVDSFHTLVGKANCCTLATIQAIQTTFSTPWKLCIIAVLLELIFVIYSTMPLGPKTYVPLESEGSPWIRIPEPLIRLSEQIISKSFLRPLIEYLSLTVMVPFMISGLMNSSQEKKTIKTLKDLKPNVFLYCASRLAVLGLVHSVFYPKQGFGWASLESGGLARNIHLSGFESVQYITTAFAMAISLHQLIRS